MAKPNPTEVAPWYLRNITQALELDEATGNVFVRTNAVLAGNVSVGNVAIGSLGNVDISGNTLPVTIDSGNVTVYQGTDPWKISGNVVVAGNVNANVSGNVVVSSGNVNAAVTGTVTSNQGTNPWVVSGSVNIGTMPEVEIKNDSGNPVPVSGTITANQGTSPWVISGAVNANVTGGNITTINDPAALTAFQEPIALQITPILQADCTYGLDPDFWSTTQLSNGNVVTTSTSTWQINSGTSPGGYARLATSRYMTYQPGQGSMFRWTAAFTTTGGTTKDALGIDNIVQNTGPIDREDGYSIGYSGQTGTDPVTGADRRKIGFLHRRNGRAEIRQLTVTTAPTGTQTATITLNSVAFTITLTASTSVGRTASQIAALLKADPIAGQQWDIDACGGIVSFIYYSPGPKNGTYSFSSTGTGTIAVASFSQLVAGNSPTDVWTYVEDWDNQGVNFDPTKLNVWALDFRWLGAGIVRLFMEDPATGLMTLMHTQRWSSTSTSPHLTKPSLRLVYRSGTTSGATPSQNVVVTGSSIMAGIQGIVNQTGSSQSYYNLDGSTRAKDTVWHLLSIQNPIIRNNGVNKTSLVIQDLSVSVKSTDPAVIYLVKNSVGTSDYLVYNPLPNATSFNFAQYSVSAVTETLSSDSLALVQTIAVGGSAQFNLLQYNFVLAPGDTISAFMSSTSAFNSTSIGITWKVD